MQSKRITRPAFNGMNQFESSTPLGISKSPEHSSFSSIPPSIQIRYEIRCGAYLKFSLYFGWKKNFTQKLEINQDGKEDIDQEVSKKYHKSVFFMPELTESTRVTPFKMDY